MISALLLVVVIIIFIASEADINTQKYQSLFAKMKIEETKGRKFSMDDLMTFAKLCISAQVSSDVIDADYKSDMITGGRNLLVDNSFHCLPYSVVNTANATLADLSECLISDVLPGTTLLISDCSSNCIGDQFLRLYDSDTNIELMSNDDG